MKVPGILKNKYILYVLLILAIINVLGYIGLNDFNSLALFVVIGLLSSYFSKNMSVNLLTAIVVTSIVAINNKVQEGFKEGEENKDEENKDETKKKATDAVSKAEKMLDHMKKELAKKDGNKDGNKETKKTCPPGKELKDGTCVTKSGFQNNVPPSSPASIKEETDESIGDRIDYAATMEQAYDNLQKMLGEDGMKSITNETKKLVSQQKDLMGTLNSMAPILSTAKETLAGLNLDDMGNMGDLLKNLQIAKK